MSVARGRDMLQSQHLCSKRRCSVRALATAATHGDGKALQWLLAEYPLFGSILTARGDGFQCLLAAACGEHCGFQVTTGKALGPHFRFVHSGFPPARTLFALQRLCAVFASPGQPSASIYDLSYVRLCTHDSPPLPPTNTLGPMHMAMVHGHLEIHDYLEICQKSTWSRVLPGHVQARICAHKRSPFIVSYLCHRAVVLDGAWATAACGYSQLWAKAESVVAKASSPMAMQWLVHAAALRGSRDVVATLRQYSSQLYPSTAEDIVDCALPCGGVANIWFVRFLLGHGVGRVRDAFPQTIRHQDTAGFARLWSFCASGDGVDDLLYLATLAYSVVDRPNRVMATLWLETFIATFNASETPTYLDPRFVQFLTENPSTATFLQDLRDEGSARPTGSCRAFSAGTSRRISSTF
ncbi:hypothetical protein SDRG_03756 [Saprolegnia diclina VS20]|uniref:C2H2-type domain-containing protein n=1 Tax=Saprolegnia diclina (strain VS20) TaxID=1156394 RepID=T0S7R1_SAPDV|nr:hypothetical protein SDRG_03756 [Saprolegnia diclina VS20]EQC38797.1 hypothetical protein SDRG_03756 [Saprolegnia diclina VS20]|eukprot:XP_008607621.1 hypothetical protein SDRG_03756 [Saprolegnia diclina VS20]